MRLLIHVGARAQRGQDDNTMAIYYYRWVQNYQIMGILPTLSSLPKSALIGAVMVDKCVTDSESEWAQPGSFHWLIKDAKLFKEPITDVKGKLGIFDYPAISEDNLPECVDIPRITRDGTHVTMPLAADVLEALQNDQEGQSLFLNLTDDICDIFLENDILRKIESFTFLVDGQKVDAKVLDSGIYILTDEDGNDLIFEEYDEWEAPFDRVCFTLKF